MKAEVRLQSDTVAFADGGVSVEVLRGRAKDGRVFLVEAEDPGKSRQKRAGNLRIYVDEPVPREIEEICSDRSGPFLLRVPSGRLSMVALGTGSETDEPPEAQTVDVPPGNYSVSLLDGSTPDAAALAAQQEALADAADWRLYERVNHFGALGCLTIALGMLFVLIPYTRREYWFLLPMFLLPSCAYSFLRRLPGYARVSERCREHEARLPQYVLSLARVETTEGLEGGWYRSQSR